MASGAMTAGSSAPIRINDNERFRFSLRQEVKLAEETRRECEDYVRRRSGVDVSDGLGFKSARLINTFELQFRKSK